MADHREYIHCGASDIGILMIHGILGSPRHFDFITPFLHRHTVRALLLPGHGGDAALFSGYRMDDWREYVKNAADGMRRKCSRFFIFAHSMGCLLAMEEALRAGANGLFLMAPPLSVRSPAKYISNGASAMSYKGDNPYTLALRDGCSVSLSSPADAAELFGGYASMLRAAAADRRIAGKLSMPVTAVFSRGDEIVSPAGSRYLPHSARRVILRDASHNYVPPHERPQVLDEAVFLLNGNG